jgi:hypothetical protein
VRGTIELGIFLLFTASIYTCTLLSFRTPELCTGHLIPYSGLYYTGVIYLLCHRGRIEVFNPESKVEPRFCATDLQCPYRELRLGGVDGGRSTVMVGTLDGRSLHS